MDPFPRLVLASASPRRRELLLRFGAPFEVFVPQGVDEDSVRGPVARRCAVLAAHKAEAGLAQVPGSRAGLVVVGSDTLVAVGDGEREEVLGKPVDAAHAREILARLSGEWHRVVSGVAIARPGRATVSAIEVSEVRFRSLRPDEIDAYVATGDADGKAGAYGIQSKGRDLVAGIRGCYYNIVGLPMTLLARLLPAGADVAWTCDCDDHPLQRGGRMCGASG